jgi:hypothetical protein
LEDELSGFPYVIYSNVSNVHDLLEKVFIYLSTMANSTLIILFSEMLKISKNYFFQIKKYCEGK